MVYYTYNYTKVQSNSFNLFDAKMGNYSQFSIILN